MLALALALLSAPAAPQSFGPEAVLTTGPALRSDGVAADMDQDGDLDLLCVGQEVGQVAWLENRGAGQFGALHGLEAALPHQLQPTSVAVGDLDGDGRPDVVVTANGLDGTSDTLGWYGAVGGGEFGTRTVLSTLGRTSGVVVDDLDGDLDQDIAYIDIDSGVSWHENLGSGAFAPQVILAPGFNTSDAIGFADLSGDGLGDLFWCEREADQVRWMRNQGGGTFAPAQSISGRFLSPDSILAEDVDLDGDSDLIVGAFNGIFRVENAGAGQFLGPVAIASMGGGPHSVTESDLDGDGDADLLSSSNAPDSLAWYENLGGGQFSQANELPGTPSFVKTVLAADLDGDGHPDPVHVASDITWFQNLGGGAIGPAETLTLTAPNRLFDADGDGDLDLIGTGLNMVSLALNRGDGSFARPEPLATGINRVTDAVLIDVGSDGDQDLVTVSYVPGQGVILRLMERTGPGLKPPVIVYQATSTSRVDLRVADLDPDGDRDLVLQYSVPGAPQTEETIWLRNDAAAGLVPLAPQGTVGYGAAAFGDVDGDGDTDFVTSARELPQLVLYRSRADGSFDAPTLLANLGTIVADPIDLGDADGDGDLDVVFSQGVSASVAWCENLGGGAFAPRSFLRVLPSLALALRAVDIDLDGDDDILVWGQRLTWGSTSGRWIESLGGGAFGPLRELPNAALLAYTTSATAADLDGDGDLDLLRAQSDVLCVQFNGRIIGTPYCGPAAIHSGGESARISASGSAAISTNATVLEASRLPVGSFGYFLVSKDTGTEVMPGGAQGTLCLGGAVGRLNRNTQEIFQSDSAGRASVAINLLNLPSPTGAMPAQPGETLYFQAWFRDANPFPTSNFTDGLGVRFRLGE